MGPSWCLPFLFLSSCRVPTALYLRRRRRLLFVFKTSRGQGLNQTGTLQAVKTQQQQQKMWVMPEGGGCLRFLNLGRNIVYLVRAIALFEVTVLDGLRFFVFSCLRSFRVSGFPNSHLPCKRTVDGKSVCMRNQGDAQEIVAMATRAAIRAAAHRASVVARTAVRERKGVRPLHLSCFRGASRKCSPGVP